MKPPAATSPGRSPRVATPALIVWQRTRHLVAESRYPGKINISPTRHLVAESGYPGKISNIKTDVFVDGTPIYQRWAGEMVCF